MRTDAITSERLGRQKALIDVLEDGIENRAANGENVELSLSVLRGERRLYRRMLSEAPLDVLETHSPGACST